MSANLAILPRYIVQRLAWQWLLFFCSLSIFIFANITLRIIQKSFDAGYPLENLGIHVLYSFVHDIHLMVILSFALAVVWTRLGFEKTKEAEAFRIFGVSDTRLFVYLSPLVGIAFVLVAVVSLWLSPKAHFASENLEIAQEHESFVDKLQAKQFNILKDGKTTVYIEKIIPNEAGATWRNLFLANPYAERPFVLTATDARLLETVSGTTRIIFQNAQLISGYDKAQDLQVLSLGEYELPYLKEQPILILEPESKNTQKLLSQTKVGNAKAAGELLLRLSQPWVFLMCFAFSLYFAKRYIDLLLVVIFFFFYQQLLLITSTLAIAVVWMVALVLALHLSVLVLLVFSRLLFYNKRTFLTL